MIVIYLVSRRVRSEIVTLYRWAYRWYLFVLCLENRWTLLGLQVRRRRRRRWTLQVTTAVERYSVCCGSANTFTERWQRGGTDTASWGELKAWGTVNSIERCSTFVRLCCEMCWSAFVAATGCGVVRIDSLCAVSSSYTCLSVANVKPDLGCQSTHVSWTGTRLLPVRDSYSPTYCTQ